MCGRFTNRLTWREIVALYRLAVPATPERNLPARYNICPTDTIDAVIERDGKRELMPMRWGLVPSWWKKKAKETPATFNARAETIAEKPMFRDAFKRSRCLIPASGYYEWQKTPTGKQPYYYTAQDGSPLTIAGLWDEWKDIESGQSLMSWAGLESINTRVIRIPAARADPHAGTAHALHKPLSDPGDENTKFYAAVTHAACII